MRGVKLKEPAFKSASRFVISRWVKLPVMEALSRSAESKVGAVMTEPFKMTAMRHPLPFEKVSRGVPVIFSFENWAVHASRSLRGLDFVPSFMTDDPFTPKAR